MWDLIVSVPDHCLSFYFLFDQFNYCKNDSLSSLYRYNKPLFAGVFHQVSVDLFDICIRIRN